MRRLEVSDLALSGPEGLILGGASLQVAAGEIVGLRGESGVGKSLLAAAIAGRLPPQVRQAAGTIRRGARLGWAPQDAADALDPWRPIQGELAATLRAHGRPATQAEAWAARVGLSGGQQRRRPGGLSGGQMQRAVLALALCGEPELLVLDEPTANLDPAATLDMAALLRETAARGAGILLISHDAGLLDGLADRLVTLSPGHRPTPRAPSPPPPASAPAVLRLCGVGAHHRGVAVLHAIDLELRQGQIVALVGASGSGKSTLGRIAAGVRRPDGGEVARSGPAGLVFQDAYGSLDPLWPVGRSIAEAMPRSAGATGRQAETTRLLRAVGLAEASGARRPAAFSGGQRQRIALARALAARPALLVCDEPTSALDPAARETVLDLLRHSAGGGTAILLISHDRDTVAGLTEDIRLLHHGRLHPA